MKSDLGIWNKTLHLVTLTGNVHATDGTLGADGRSGALRGVDGPPDVAGNVHVTDNQLDARSTDGAYDTEKHLAERWAVNGVERHRQLRADHVTYDKDIVRDRRGQRVGDRFDGDAVPHGAPRRA